MSPLGLLVRVCVCAFVHLSVSGRVCACRSVSKVCVVTITWLYMRMYDGESDGLLLYALLSCVFARAIRVCMCITLYFSLCARTLAHHLVSWLLKLKNLAASSMRATHPIRDREKRQERRRQESVIKQNERQEVGNLVCSCFHDELAV